MVRTGASAGSSCWTSTTGIRVSSAASTAVPRRINEIVHGKRGITADTAIRLARYFGTSEELWMNLQSNYELRLERRASRGNIAAITPLRTA